METTPDPNIMPEVDLFPRFTKFIQFVLGRSDVPMHMSDHYDRAHFVEPAQPELPFGEAE